MVIQMVTHLVIHWVTLMVTQMPKVISSVIPKHSVIRMDFLKDSLMDFRKLKAKGLDSQMMTQTVTRLGFPKVILMQKDLAKVILMVIHWDFRLDFQMEIQMPKVKGMVTLKDSLKDFPKDFHSLMDLNLDFPMVTLREIRLIRHSPS